MLKHGGHGRWHNERRRERHNPFARWRDDREAAPSTNSAFETYRQATLRRLEEEEREFHDYLERLRRAKDKEEFDQFMSELRTRPARDEDDDAERNRRRPDADPAGATQPQG